MHFASTRQSSDHARWHWRRIVWAAAVAAALILSLHDSARAQCEGDCDGNDTVAINELILAVRIALGSAAAHDCAAVDRNNNHTVSIDELFRIAREAQVPATIHHLKTAYKQNWGRMPQILARLEQARAEGLDVAADQYPYTAASNPLDANLPVWAREGGREALLARIKDPAQRAREHGPHQLSACAAVRSADRCRDGTRR